MSTATLTCAICTPGGRGAVCAACLTTAPMRRVQECSCATCGHGWIAPKRGDCPKCHSDQTQVDVDRTNGLKRL